MRRCLAATGEGGGAAGAETCTGGSGGCRRRCEATFPAWLRDVVGPSRAADRPFTRQATLRDAGGRAPSALVPDGALFLCLLPLCRFPGKNLLQISFETIFEYLQASSAGVLRLSHALSPHATGRWVPTCLHL